MNANELNIEVKNNGRYLYNSLEVNDEVLNRYWNKAGGYVRFSQFRDLNGFNNLQALEELTIKNKDHSLCAIGTNQIFTHTKSDLNNDFETIIIDFEDKAEAELYKDYLEKNLKTNSVMKPSFEVKNNQLEYTYCRVCLDENNKKLYRTAQQRLTLNNLPDNQVMNSVNENCLLLIKAIHTKDKERLFVYKAKQGVIGIVSSNDSLGLNDTNITKLKEDALQLTNDTNKEVKKEKLETRGSNVVNSNIKQEKIKDKTEEKIEKEIEEETKDITMTSFDSFMLVQQKLLETKLKDLKDNKDTIMQSYDNFIADGLKHNEVIDKLSKSYKNEYLGDFVANNLKDRQLETQTLKEQNKTLIKQVSTLSGNIVTLKNHTETLTTKLEEQTSTIDTLSSIIEEIEPKLEQVKIENKTLEEQNASLRKDNASLLNENNSLMEDHNKVALENAELKSELSNKTKDLLEVQQLNSKLAERNKDLESKTSNLEEINKLNQTEIQSQRDELEKMRSEMKRMSDSLNELQKENLVLKTKNETLEKVFQTKPEEKKEEKNTQDNKYGLAEKFEKIIDNSKTKPEEKKEEKLEEKKDKTKRQQR